MAAIHQFVAGFARGDAISNEALSLRRIFQSWGVTSAIFTDARRAAPELRSEVRDVAEASSALAPQDVVLLHLSIGSAVNTVFERIRCRKAILYHNVTPPRYFALINGQTASILEQGLKQVRALAGAAEVNMADSGFNAAELESCGYANVKVLPLVLDFDLLNTEPDRGVLRQMNDGRTNILFVGRGAPNKKIEDVLTAFSMFRRHVRPDARLIHVGSYNGTELYHNLLLKHARDLGADAVCLPGNVPQSTLTAYYRSAHLFLCMSEHEGFCIPIIESMHHGVPVMAYAAGAVPETMDHAGILFQSKDYPMIAETMGRLLDDDALRKAVVEAQHERIRRYRNRDVPEELRRLLSPLLPP
jgi:glycosyltransferase involved in cell wall biosynthesis